MNDETEYPEIANTDWYIGPTDIYWYMYNVPYSIMEYRVELGWDGKIGFWDICIMIYSWFTDLKPLSNTLLVDSLLVYFPRSF